MTPTEWAASADPGPMLPPGHGPAGGRAAWEPRADSRLPPGGGRRRAVRRRPGDRAGDGTSVLGRRRLHLLQHGGHGASRAELRKAAYGDDAGWAGRVRADEMTDEDMDAFAAAADPAAWIEAERDGEDDENYLNDVFDPFRDVADDAAVEVGETIGRQVLLLVRTHLGAAAEAAERAAQAAQAGLVRGIFGEPGRPAFDPIWRTTTVTDLAASIYESRAFHDLPVLADALEDAGCDAADVLGHLRGGRPHARGCWAVDPVLGRG